ncbi:MAG: GTP cyclohydrolase II [Acidobacteria bacterium]|nr:GTP cyclohydrolase II [Acidobacteriota bacterium]MCB9398108.1 GTP cyclohydrolase II [Acidobacteriota bacterium]
MKFSTVEAAIEAIRAGRFVVVVDDENRENEGDLIIAAEHIDAKAINFMIQNGRGLVCLAMGPSIFDALGIPLMVASNRNHSKFQTNFGVSIGAREGITTGISAPDRAATIQAAIRPGATRDDITMPGHIFPIRARENGVLERRGHTEAAVDLARLAGLRPAGVICEIIKEDGTMARLPDLIEFAQAHQLPVLTIEDLSAYRMHREPIVRRIDTANLPTSHGVFTVHAFQDHRGWEHLAFTCGDLEKQLPLARLHSECLTGDVFGSLRCDCGDQLQQALAQIQEQGCGVLVYLRQEGRGIGLANKIKAYALQDRGMDTVEANLHLGFPEDARTFDIGAAILKDLGVRSVRLLTNNPNKMRELEACGVKIQERVPLIVPANPENQNYLQVKATRLGHLLQNVGENIGASR